MSKKNDDKKKISYNVGDFKVLKSDVNLNLKNFIGYNDDDLKIVSDFNNSSISLAVKDSVYINNSTYIGYNQNDIIHKINKDINNDENDNTYKLDVKGDTNLDGNLIIKDKLFVSDSVFFNKDIFLPNPYILEDEDISSINILNITGESLSFSTYKYLLKNILDKTKNSSQKNISSIKFFNESTLFTQTIIPINKKFIFNQIEIYSFLLSYCIYFGNKIIEVKPIMDTFVLINNDKNIFKLTIDIDTES
jgi:hypothetical protein